MATGFQVGPEKRRGRAIQRSDAAKVPHGQSLQADNEFCDVARGIRDVVKIPINHRRPSCGENNLMFAIVPMAGAGGNGVAGWRGRPQPFQQLFTLAGQEPVSFGYEAALTFRTAEESLRSEEHTSELQSRLHLVCRLLLE